MMRLKIMRPNFFKMNTDYLSIAQTSKNEFVFVVAGGTVPAYDQVIKTNNYNVPSQAGAIDQIMIKQDSQDYKIGYMSSIIVSGTVIGTIYVYRTSKNNLRAEVRINNLSSSTPLTFPTMTFSVKVSSFRPPNVF